MMRSVDVNTTDDYIRYLNGIKAMKAEGLASNTRIVACEEAMVVYLVMDKRIKELEQKIQRLERGD